MPESSQIIVVGAGVGGLTTALALAQAGKKVLLLEKSRKLEEVGAGLQLSANASACLESLGLLPALTEVSFQPDNVRISSGYSGRKLADVPLGDTVRKRYGAPHLVIHRADLQTVLLEKVLAEPAITLALGQGFESYAEDPSGKISVTCKTTNGDIKTYQADALIGADGVRSQVRKQVRDTWQANYSGRTAYRTTIAASQIPENLLTNTGLWFGANAHIVHYPVNGRENFNIVILVEEDWRTEGWSEPADRQALMAHFKDWHPSIRNVIEIPQRWTRWALCAADGNLPWVKGRIALLGDAAHAMLPFAAQGAGCAIEDAIVLAKCLSTNEDTSAALLEYQSLRQARAVKIQDSAAKNGKIYHMHGPLAFARDTVLRLSSPESLISRMDWIYDWKP
ncbi:MAG: FAD-dependent monooxygenase [Rhodobacteraceae bacterium]|nr:FAD-dependent monooxygenase [Paracoccaceae bacterium]